MTIDSVFRIGALLIAFWLLGAMVFAFLKAVYDVTKERRQARANHRGGKRHIYAGFAPAAIHDPRVNVGGYTTSLQGLRSDGFAPTSARTEAPYTFRTPIGDDYLRKWEHPSGETVWICEQREDLRLLQAATRTEGMARITKFGDVDLENSLTLRAGAAAMLLLALAPLPYGYYVLLRWVVCIACVFTVVAIWRKRTFWKTAFVVLAVLFNPLIPVYLDRETWAILDVGTAVVLVYSLFAVNNQPHFRSSRKDTAT